MSKSNKTDDASNSHLEANAIATIIESQKKFISFLESKVKNISIAEDIFQMSILKALKNGKDLKSEEAVFPWFYQILKNSVTDYFRENKKISGKSEEIYRFLSELSNEASFNKESKELLCECFKELIKTINPGYADLLNKVDINDESLEDLAKAQNMTVNNITVKLHRARKALKESLEVTCGACTKHGCLNCTCNM